MSDDETLFKKQFAQELLRNPTDPFKAGLAVFGNLNTGKALQVSQLWINDPEVLAEKEALLAELGARHFLPSKEDFARKVLDFTETLSAAFADEKLKGYKLYGEIMGYIEKPAVNVTNNNTQNTQNNVMLVKDHGSDEEWESKLQQQQKGLINGASVTAH